MTEAPAIRNLSDMELAVLEGVICAVNASDFTSEVISIGYYNIVNIEALVVSNGDIVGDDLTGLAIFLSASLWMETVPLSRYDHIDSRRIKQRYYRSRNTSHRHPFSRLLIIALYRVGIGNVDGLPCSDFRNRPSIIAVIGVLVCIGGIDALANKELLVKQLFSRGLDATEPQLSPVNWPAAGTPASGSGVVGTPDPR